jgi:hypothetical protein
VSSRPAPQLRLGLRYDTVTPDGKSNVSARPIRNTLGTDIMDKDGILIDLSESERTKFGKEAFAAQSIPQKVFSSVWALESEVNNGGFSQYFLNRSSETAPFAAEALDSIGAPLTADICRRAIACAFPAELPSTPNAISTAAAQFPDATLDELEALDSDFFAYPHDLTALLFAYVSAHPEEFGELPRTN